MNKNFKNFILILSLIVLGLGSCKTRRKTIVNKENQTTDTISQKCKLTSKKAKVLSKHIKENELNYQWLSAKADVDATVDGVENKLDVKIRGRKDSAIWISIQAIGFIDIAKLLITRDSVKMVVYLKKQYFKGDFNYINELLNADLDFDMIQATLFGNSAEFYEDDDKLNSVLDKENCLYLLSTERKRKLRRINSGQEIAKRSLQTMTLMNETYKIINNHFEDVTSNRTFNAKYDNFYTPDSVFAPHNVDIVIKAEKNITLKINYVRIEINQPQKINLTIPKSYAPIPIKKEKTE
ncbi:MAG: DUF4292 domain-containing protein [Bacteroidota bacterium]|jgi:hypothetical protein